VILQLLLHLNTHDIAFKFSNSHSYVPLVQKIIETSRWYQRADGGECQVSLSNEVCAWSVQTVVCSLL